MTKLTLIDKAFFLKKTILFSNLDLDLLLAIADKLQMVTFEGSQTIFGIGEEAYRMYFVVNGTVEIQDANQRPLATLGPEEFFGEESLFSDKVRAYHAFCKTNCMLLSLSRTNLFTIISECPSVAVGFLQVYSSMTSFRPRRKE